MTLKKRNKFITHDNFDKKCLTLIKKIRYKNHKIKVLIYGSIIFFIFILIASGFYNSHRIYNIFTSNIPKCHRQILYKLTEMAPFVMLGSLVILFVILFITTRTQKKLFSSCKSTYFSNLGISCR